MAHGTILALLLPGVLLTAACGGPTSTDQGPRVIQVAEVTYGQGESVNLLIILPDEAATGQAAPVVMAFPWGAGTTDLLAGMLREYWDEAAPSRGYIVVGVQALGSSLDTLANVLIPAVFAWMDENLTGTGVAYDPDAVVAAGASNGGRGLFHAALAAPDKFAALVGMPGEYSGEASDLQPLAAKPVWLLVGEFDNAWRDLTDDTAAKLESVGSDVTVEVVPGQGHVLSLNENRLMDWIDAALGRE